MITALTGRFIFLCPIYLDTFMSSFLVDSFDSSSVSMGDCSNGLDILNKNTLTTAGVLVAGSTGVAAAALVATALPAQMLIAAGTSAGLIYAGDRQSKGLSINPFSKTETPVTTEVVAQ